MRARNPIRRAQLIAPFGVGALMVLKDGTGVITAGLDHWFEREDRDDTSIELAEFQVNEWRLQRSLHVDHFRLPPDHRTRRPGVDTPNIGLKIPCFRFPRWHQCPHCNRLTEQPLGLRERPRCPECQERNLIQVPIIAVCEEGHLQDFPWREWVHASIQPACAQPLRLVATGGSTLAAQKVTCGCGKVRTLANITVAEGNTTFLTSNLDKNGEYLCRGLQLWHGTTTRSACSHAIRGSQRSASNVYFADVRSAIYLPPAEDVSAELIQLLEEPPLAIVLKLFHDVGTAPTAQQLRAVHGQLLEPFTDEDITTALHITRESHRKLHDERIETDNPRTAFRRPEYTVLQRPCSGPQLRVTTTDLARYEPSIIPYFEQITLVERLRETRALAGFTRIFPDNQQDLNKRKALLWRAIPASAEWLPAYVVYGEGIFIKLNSQLLAHWERQDVPLRRASQLNDTYLLARQSRGLPARQITPRFVLAHTLSHILMNRLVFECGYSSAALRERLYVSDDPNAPMAGILLYTAAGDAEGSMGGLVRMGKTGNLEPVLRRGLEAATWCSADPVCTEVGAQTGQGPDSCNLAACHNCALVPETACEEFNRFLDRATLIGARDAPEAGFFNLGPKGTRALA